MSSQLPSSKKKRMEERRAGGRNSTSDPALTTGGSTHIENAELLKVWANEVEPYKKSQKGSSVQVTDYRPTYRAVLARKGFLVKATLGSGSYSKVRLAQYIKGDNKYDSVAVKIMDRMKAPQDFQDKFLPRELDVWPRIKHINIVRMYEYFQENGRVYMILEYCEGGDALRYIQSSGALSESMSRTWVHQVSDAVRYLHSLNITHRDLKLENMLLDSNQNIKLCDFGFVKPQCMAELSKTFCGSKSYAAPEILKGEPYQPKKADIWAIGVILFILVTGRMPFDETKGNASLLEEHRKLALMWPRGARKVSAECKALVKFCFTFNWPERPSIQQVLAHPWFKSAVPGRVTTSTRQATMAKADAAK